MNIIEYYCGKALVRIEENKYILVNIYTNKIDCKGDLSHCKNALNIYKAKIADR